MTTGPDALLERIRAATADEYLIEREIGRGGMAAVFLARDTALERRVAMKVMLPDLINVHGVQDRFVIEARTAAHLDHPGIVTVYAVKQRAGLLFIVMKYIEGHTLEAVLRSQGQIDPTAAALIGSRVAEALNFAHDEGVVHRDVKPSNIMIDRRGRPVVTDFGIARVMAGQSITIAGSMLGTPTHMSPEQCRGQPATAASDQYSLGVTIYEMLTGRVPFTGSLFELITAHREQSPPPLSDFVVGVDPALEYTVMRMLAKEPSGRWGSMADVVQQLSAHTTMNRGDENLRATLVLSSAGSQLPTQERGVASADVLTPPTPVSVSGPPSPVPFAAPMAPASSGPAQVNVVRDASVAGADNSPGNQRRVLIGSAAVVLVVVAAAAVMWSGWGNTQTAVTASRGDSVPPVAQTAASQAVRDSVAKDSAAKDSTARVTAARDSVVRDSVARDSVAKESAAKAAAALRALRTPVVRRSATDSARPRRRPPESLAVECARLLERASLGEKLTESERAVLSRRCQK